MTELTIDAFVDGQTKLVNTLSHSSTDRRNLSTHWRVRRWTDEIGAPAGFSVWENRHEGYVVNYDPQKCNIYLSLVYMWDKEKLLKRGDDIEVSDESGIDTDSEE